MAGSLEIRLFNFIRDLHREILDMKSEGGYKVDLNSLQNELNNVTINDFKIYDIDNKYLKEV